MPSQSPEVDLRWRDENYGSVWSVAAFRNYATTVDWPAHTRKLFQRCLMKAGFKYNDKRCSYIAANGTADERKQAIYRELKAAGFRIIGGDIATSESG